MKPFLLVLSVVFLASSLAADDLGSPFDHWPVDLRINGKIVIGLAPEDASVLRDSLSRSDVQGKVVLLVEPDLSEDEFVRYARVFSGASDYRVVRRNTESGFAELSDLLLECDTFLWRSTKTLDKPQAKQILQQRRPFSDFVERGGTLVFLGPAAIRTGAVYTNSKGDVTDFRRGLGLMPDCLVQLDNGPTVREQILKALDNQPATVGFGVAAGTLLKL